MGMWTVCEIFAQGYVEEMNTAIRNDDWDAQTAVYQEARRIQRELGHIVRAVETMRRYNIKVD